MTRTAAKGRILVVDDEASARTSPNTLLKAEHYVVEMAADGFKALGKLADFAPDLILTDLQMPGMSGIELMQKAREHDPDVGVILMTAFGAVETAVQAMRAGASDYLTKPLNLEELIAVLEREGERRRLKRETRELRERLAERYRFETIVGASPEMQAVFETITRVADSRATVLITGDSGTGKELVAAAIHERSSRRTAPFVKLHCAALSANLLESELFGHEKGAFTGADRRREGRFERAHGGTLFLDEISEIPPATQVKLLRVLQEREFERVGGNETIEVDVRLIAATNRDLKDAVRSGTFREDLYYRLNVVEIRLPTLRERTADVPLIASHFLRKHATENGKVTDRFSEAALGRILSYPWPGKVRELENAIERAVVLCNGTQVEVTDLPPELAAPGGAPSVPTIPGSTIADLERYAILRTLEACRGSTTRAAEILGMSIRKIQYKLQEFAAAPKSGIPTVIRRQAEATPDGRHDDSETGQSP